MLGSVLVTMDKAWERWQLILWHHHTKECPRALGELAWLVIQIFQKNPTKFLQLTSISREMHNLFTVPADQGLRLVDISVGLRREASLKN